MEWPFCYYGNRKVTVSIWTLSMNRESMRGGRSKETMPRFEKYIDLAKSLHMVDARLISSEDIFFDIRAILKCRWGCEDFFKGSIKCHTRDTSFQDRVDMVKAYETILIVHSHNAQELSRAVLEIEKQAFLDGFYLSFAIRYCKLCETCAVDYGNACPTPKRVRPCDQSFGIDVYKTAGNLGLPCEVLQSGEDIQNR